LLLQQAYEFLALFRGEDLLDTAAAFAEHRTVILPEIVENGFDLIGLGGGEVEFFLEAVKVESLALGGLETGRAEPVMDAEIHDQGAGQGATKKDQREADAGDEPGVPRASEGRPFENARATAHRPSR